MKILKWLLGTLVVLLLVIGVGVAALVYLVDWNDFRDTIQNQVRKQTGRDLQITGDLSPSVFPWAGISIGEISLANAQGFGEVPFASIDSADVKVELLPLIKREINVRTVELKGLQLDLQRAADGTTNWDDLVKPTTTTTTTTVDGEDADTQVTTEVEGSSATIAALSVGGIQVLDANVSWRDATTDTDAALSSFNLQTDAIELAEPFALDVEFTVASNSLDLTADVRGQGELTIDLDQQIYTIDGFTLNTDARGGALPVGALSATLAAEVVAKLGEQQISVSSLSLETLGLVLDGQLDVQALDTAPTVSGQFASNEFSPRELMQQLGIEVPVTADEAVLSKASLQLALAATPESAAVNDLQIVLDDTTFSGTASVPTFGGGMPPLRFDLAVDAIDLDRYLPPSTDTADEQDTQQAPPSDQPAADVPIELPVELMRQLDIDGRFRVGSVTVSHLNTRDIVVPVKASNGRLALQDMQANLYEGRFGGTASVDVSAETPAYGVTLSLSGIQADPLLADLLQKSSFLSGQGDFSADIRTRGETVDQLTAGLDGGFETDFTDGSINGINIGYQIRRAKAALSGQSLPAEEGVVKTDFSSLSVSGRFDDGVLSSNDLDMRSPLLRLGGQGQVDLPGESVDYTLTTLITGTAQGQGGADLESLAGVKLSVPIRGSFAALAADPAGVIVAGMRDNISDNLKNQARAIADEKAAEIEAQARELQAEKEAELQQKAEELKSEALEKAQEKLEGLFK